MVMVGGCGWWLWLVVMIMVVVMVGGCGQWSWSWLLWASPVPPHLKRGSRTKAPSLSDPTLKPSYSQVVKTKTPLCDPEKQACDPGKVTHDISCDPSPALIARDYTCDYTQPHDPT